MVVDTLSSERERGAMARLHRAPEILDSALDFYLEPLRSRWLDEDEDPDEEWYEAVVRSEIQPLLHEYWLDQPGNVVDLVSRLLR